MRSRWSRNTGPAATNSSPDMVEGRAAAAGRCGTHGPAATAGAEVEALPQRCTNDSNRYCYVTPCCWWVTWSTSNGPMILQVTGLALFCRRVRKDTDGALTPHPGAGAA
jgi:hypothetical protein